MENQEQKHQRRPRYQGTHPKTFQDKYKELQPELYADTIAKVIQKGNTPAGMHRSICVKEILEFLQITPSQVGCKKQVKTYIFQQLFSSTFRQ